MSYLDDLALNFDIGLQKHLMRRRKIDKQIFFFFLS